MAKNRQPVRALNLTPEQVANAAKAEKARKATSKAALKAAREAANADAPEADPVSTQAELPEAAKPDHADQDRANAIAAQRVDWEALGSVGTFEAYLVEQGFEPDGTAHEAKTPYAGPMLALVAARRTYVKAANGILCNGSPLAVLCGQYKREVVVAALVDALKLPGNPYLTLNPGQQSMNLRNKARHAMVNGTLAMGEIEAYLKAHAAK